MNGNDGMRKRPNSASEPMLGDADRLGYRRPLPGFSTNDRDASANDRAAQGFSTPAELTGGMDRMLAEGETRRLPDLGMASSRSSASGCCT